MDIMLQLKADINRYYVPDHPIGLFFLPVFCDIGSSPSVMIHLSICPDFQLTANHFGTHGGDYSVLYSYLPNRMVLFFLCVKIIVLRNGYPALELRNHNSRRLLCNLSGD